MVVLVRVLAGSLLEEVQYMGGVLVLDQYTAYVVAELFNMLANVFKKVLLDHCPISMMVYTGESARYIPTSNPDLIEWVLNMY